MKSLKQIHNEHHRELLGRSNVVAVGLGYKTRGGVKTNELAVVCSVTKKLPKHKIAPEDLIPPKIEERPTDVVETGIIRALKERTDRWRPAPGGVSVGHQEITAGTLGCLVKKGGKVYILSNNHVLANSNAGKAGDQILQPGPHDGGQLTMDMVARLSEFVPIKFILDGDGCKIGNAFTAIVNIGLRATRRKTRLAARQEFPENRVDAAIAEPGNLNDVNERILEIGLLAGRREIGLGSMVKKSGRTTGVTEGIVDQVGVAVQVQYGGSRIALFIDQFMIKPGNFSAGGDSGSAVLTKDNYLAGLLFAGSDEITVVNPVKHVFRELGLDGI